MTGHKHIHCDFVLQVSLLFPFAIFLLNPYIHKGKNDVPIDQVEGLPHWNNDHNSYNSCLNNRTSSFYYGRTVKGLMGLSWRRTSK